MIIYGYKNRNIEIASGQFICPRCDTERTYKHVNVVRYFTLFFIITLFPLGRVGSYIECQTCMTVFKPEEIAGTRGNELFSAEIAARKVESDRRTKASRGRSLAVIGAILALIGVCFLAILVVFQLTNYADPTEDLIGLFLLMAVCPLPLTLAGVGLLFWGINIRRSVTESTAAGGSLPVSTSMQ